MAVSGGYKLKVSTDVLASTSQNIGSAVKQMRTSFEETAATIENSSGYWIGSAGEKHRRVYNKYKSDIEEILRRFEEHQNDLLRMANRYDRAEKSAENKAYELPTNILS